ncbi:MAG: hypothetical protein IK083_01840 [Abditibacteriota bacterium]|nr:hypothetical protein [Abditibacteriota bacterium]
MKAILAVILCALWLSAGALAAEKVELSAGSIDILYDGARPREAYLEGDVKAGIRDMVITSGKGHVDYASGDASFWEDLQVTSDSFEGSGDSVTVNMNTGDIRSGAGSLTLLPAGTKGTLAAPVFVKSGSLSRAGGVYTAGGASFTGCDSGEPHYLLQCREMTVYPGRRIVLKSAAFFWRGRHVMTLPYVSVPLDDRYDDPRATPRTGFSDTEGWFAKLAYPYNPRSERYYGLLLFDVMSKKGFGLGVRQDYGNSGGNVKGQAGVYHIINTFGEGNYSTFNFRHTGEKGPLYFNASLEGRNTAYKGRDDVKRYFMSARLGYKTTATDALLDWSRIISDTGYKTENDLVTLSLKHKLSSRMKFAGTVSYSDFSYTAYRRELVTSKLTLEGSEQPVDWSLGALLYDELSGSGYRGTEKRPELILSSDTARLGITGSYGLDLVAGYSRLKLPEGSTTDRILFEAGLPDYRIDLGADSYISANARYRQLYYASDMAKYSLGGNVYYNLGAGPNKWRLDYRYQQPRGYSPVSSDYISRYNYLNLRWIYDLAPLYCEVFGGYDFASAGRDWLDVNAKIKYAPSDSLSAYLAASYSPDRSRLKTIIGQVTMGKDSTLSLGAHYNALSKKLTGVKALGDLSLGKSWRLRAYLSYDGYEKELDYIIGELTRRYHCYDVSFLYRKQTGSYSDESFMLSVKLDIFPPADDFAAGLNGTGIDTGVGTLNF